MLLILTILHGFHMESARAAPIQNLRQTVIAPSWVADPTSRGTWSILYSCLFTLLLCVYTAIHLNVPPFYDTTLSFYLRKVKWVLIAVFAPEIVLYTAFEQFIMARKFLKELNKITDDAISNRNTDKKLKVRFPPIYSCYRFS
jgi:hypothetical protein